jgi:putative two-component system response regulator
MSERPRILVVDDDEMNREMLSLSLRSLGTVRTAVDGIEALAMIEQELPDLVLTDVLMPRMNGLEVCRRLKKDPRTRLIPVIIQTSLDQMPSKIQALELDADDYLTKPVNLTELLARTRSLLRLKHYTDELENASNVLRAVAEIVESRDRYVSKHCQDVAHLCAKVAISMGLDADAIVRLRLGASFHDIGKIGVADEVLHKAGPLNEEELRQMREHAALGASLLEPMRTLKAIVPLVRHHHEKLDGSGYPDGLKGEQIPLEVRILTVVDIYAALAAERPYKKALPPSRAIAILREEAAHGWWDAEVVEVLASLMLKSA